MNAKSYRIESQYPMVGPLVSRLDANCFYIEDRSLAVAIAAKSDTEPKGKEIRVVHQLSGTVVFCKTGLHPRPTLTLARRQDES